MLLRKNEIKPEVVSYYQLKEDITLFTRMPESYKLLKSKLHNYVKELGTHIFSTCGNSFQFCERRMIVEKIIL